MSREGEPHVEEDLKQLSCKPSGCLEACSTRADTLLRCLLLKCYTFFAEISCLKAGTGKVRSDEPGLVQVNSSEVDAAKVHLTKIGVSLFATLVSEDVHMKGYTRTT